MAVVREGDRFGVYGADSTGEVISVGGESVTYRFDHAPEVKWGRNIKEFLKVTFPIVSKDSPA